MNTNKSLRYKASDQARRLKNSRTASGRALVLANATALAVGGNRLLVKHFEGECPPFNDEAQRVYDPASKKLFVFGGKHPGDRSLTPSADFYCCSIWNLEWTNLSLSLRYRIPTVPYSEMELKTVKKPLPRLTLPGVTSFSVHGSHFMLIFGGYDDDESQVSSQLIMVDLTNLAWWYVEIGGGSVSPRINPCIVAIGNKLYIFGGYQRFGDDPRPHFSYCVAEFNPTGWRWESRDVAYSPSAHGRIFGEAISAYDGTKIILTPGRTTGGEKIQFTEDNIFSFHTERKKFHLEDVTGSPPKNVCWYHCFPDPFSHTPPSSLSLGSQGARSSGSRTAAPSPTSYPGITTPMSIIICAWVPWQNSKVIATAELWRLSMTPMEWRFDCLDISEKVYEVDQDLECAMVIGQHLMLLGYQPVSEATPRMLVSVDPAYPDEKEDIRGVYNIFVNVPIPPPAR